MISFSTILRGSKMSRFMNDFQQKDFSPDHSGLIYN